MGLLPSQPWRRLLLKTALLPRVLFPPYAKPLLLQVVPRIEAETDLRLTVEGSAITITTDAAKRLLDRFLEGITQSTQTVALTPLMRAILESLGEAWLQRLATDHAVITVTPSEAVIHSFSTGLARRVRNRLTKRMAALLSHRADVTFTLKEFQLLAGWNGEGLQPMALALGCSLTVNPTVLTLPRKQPLIIIQVHATSSERLKQVEFYLRTRLEFRALRVAQSAVRVPCDTLKHALAHHKAELQHIQQESRVVVFLDPTKEEVSFRASEGADITRAQTLIITLMDRISHQAQTVIGSTKVWMAAGGVSLNHLRQSTSASVFVTTSGNLSVYHPQEALTKKATTTARRYAQPSLQLLHFAYPMFSALKRLGPRLGEIETATSALISLDDQCLTVAIAGDRGEPAPEGAIAAIEAAAEAIATYTVLIPVLPHVARFLRRRNAHGVTNAAEIETKAASIVVVEATQVTLFSDSAANLEYAKTCLQRVVFQLGERNLVGGTNPNHAFQLLPDLSAVTSSVSFPHHLLEAMELETTKCSWTYHEGKKPQNGYLSTVLLRHHDRGVLQREVATLTARAEQLRSNQIALPLEPNTDHDMVTKIKALFPGTYTVEHKIRHVLQVPQKFNLSAKLTVTGLNRKEVEACAATLRQAFLLVFAHQHSPTKLIPLAKVSRFHALKLRLEALYGVRLVEVTPPTTTNGSQRWAVVSDDYTATDMAFMALGAILKASGLDSTAK